MRALSLFLVILLAHMTVMTSALWGVSISGGGQPLTVMTKALRSAFATLDRRASFRYFSPEEGPPIEEAAWGDELRRILQLHPAGALALGLRMSSPEPEPEEQAVAALDPDSEQALAALDPDFLEEASADCVCALCFGVMVEPTSGCPDGHSFCRACYLQTLHQRNSCPTCRHPVAADNSFLQAGTNSTFKLVRNRPLENVISLLKMRCEHAEGEIGKEAAGNPMVEGANLAPSPSLPVELVPEQLSELLPEHSEELPQGLPRPSRWRASQSELVARREEGEKQGGGCSWKGRVGKRAAHLRECEWAPVTCSNRGCTESRLRKDLPEHSLNCDSRKIPCRHCKWRQGHQSLAAHEGRCPEADIECEGCGVQHHRGSMDVHRVECQHEEVSSDHSSVVLIRTSIHDEYDLMLFWHIFGISCGCK